VFCLSVYCGTGETARSFNKCTNDILDACMQLTPWFEDRLDINSQLDKVNLCVSKENKCLTVLW
jgi:hypothetical protein